MMALVRLAWRDLLGHRRFTLLFIINLGISLIGFLLVGSFGASVDRHLSTHLRDMLTADLTLQSSRPLTPEELETVRSITDDKSHFSRQISLYTMIQGKNGTRLTQIIAVDAAYPLYGHFRFADQNTRTHQAITGLQQQHHIMLSRETARFFGLSPGDALDIGQTPFSAAVFFENEPGGDLSALNFAPKVYLGLEHLEQTDLVRFGSRISYTTFIRLPEGTNSTAIASKLSQSFTHPTDQSPSIRVVTAADSNRTLQRLFSQFHSFLAVTSLVALALAAITAAHLFQTHLDHSAKELFILLTLGARHSHCLLLATGKLILLGLIAVLGAVMAAWLLLPLFTGLFTGILPSGLTPHLDPLTMALALLIATCGSILFCLPALLRIQTIHPLLLWREQESPFPLPTLPQKQTIIAMLPGIALLLLLTIFLSHTPSFGLLFVVGLFLLVALFALIASFFFRCCQRWSATGPLLARIALRNLYRRRRTATAVFVALGIVLLLTNIIPQIEKGLAAEISHPKGLTLPNLFLIDIQEEQKQPLIHFFHKHEGVLSSPAPMVQGRITRINNVPFSLWRQQHRLEGEQGLRRTEFNFSSRLHPDPSETIVEGAPLPAEPWQMATQQPFAISMEKEFSKRLQVKRGDRIVVDIQGIEMEGEIVNLRRVRWASFQPNFFMLLQPGVLDDAPKTFLASVSRVDKTMQPDLVKQLAISFPNISVLDVNGLVTRLMHITEQLTRAVRFLAALVMVTGLIAVIAVTGQDVLRREREINLMRVLGAGRNTIRLLLTLELCSLATAAAVIAFFCSLLCSHTISWLLFDHLWSVQWGQALLLLLSAVALCATIAVTAADSVTRQRPVLLLS